VFILVAHEILQIPVCFVYVLFIEGWEDNIKIDLQEVGGVRGHWMRMAQDRDRWRALVGTVRDFRVP
jgi:hypothetical protein